MAAPDCRPRQYDDLTRTCVSQPVVNSDSLEGGNSSAREAQFAVLVENMTHQLHFLGYNEDYVHSYHKALTIPTLRTPLEIDVGPVASTNIGTRHSSDTQNDVPDHPRHHAVMQPLHIEQTRVREIEKSDPVLSTGNLHRHKIKRPIAVRKKQSTL